MLLLEMFKFIEYVECCCWKCSNSSFAQKGQIKRLFVLGNEFLQLVNVCSGQLVNLLSILDVNEGWHSSDLILLSNFLVIVNINIQKDNIVHGFGHFFKMRSNHLAGTAPGCKEVYYDQLSTGSAQLSLEVITVSNCVNHFQFSCRSESSNIS